jgi:lysozyme family protein
MSLFTPALNFVLDNEDRNRTYVATVDNNGGNVIAGINSKSWPEDYAKIAALPHIGRGAAIGSFYSARYFIPLKLGAITSQDVANRVMDMAVNGGSGTAVKLLQQAVNSLGGKLAVDGGIGTETLLAVNMIDSTTLVNAYKAVRIARYEAIVKAHPEDETYLRAWEARAEE